MGVAGGVGSEWQGSGLEGRGVPPLSVHRIVNEVSDVRVLLGEGLQKRHPRAILRTRPITGRGIDSHPEG